jgi:hypothetical protein
MSPHADAMLSTLRRGFGSFYCRPCLSKGIRVAVDELRTAWAEIVAHSGIELNKAPCVECLQPRTVVRIRPTN